MSLALATFAFAQAASAQNIIQVPMNLRGSGSLNIDGEGSGIVTPGFLNEFVSLSDSSDAHQRGILLLDPTPSGGLPLGFITGATFHFQFFADQNEPGDVAASGLRLFTTPLMDVDGSTASALAALTADGAPFTPAGVMVHGTTPFETLSVSLDAAATAVFKAAAVDGTESIGFALREPGFVSSAAGDLLDGMTPFVFAPTVLADVDLDADQDGLDFGVDADSDGDGIPDAIEADLGLDLGDASDGLLDFDVDGASNADEYRASSAIDDAGSTPDDILPRPAKVFASDGTDQDGFGAFGEISGDLAVIGAPNLVLGQSDPGAAYVFARTGDRWVEEAKLVPSDGSPDDLFGRPVSIDGDTIAVGAFLHDGPAGVDSGAVYVFGRGPGGIWTETQKLTPDLDDPPNCDCALDPGDQFGRGVQVSGDVLIASGFLDDEQAPDAGAIYVYTRSAGTWTLADKLTASDGAMGDRLGLSTAIVEDRIVAGSDTHDANGSESGAVYVFRQVAVGDWEEIQKVDAGAFATAGDRFGASLAAEGDDLVVGAPRRDSGALSDVGNAFAFLWTDATSSYGLALGGRLAPPIAATADDFFGQSVTIDGDRLVVSAPFADGAAANTGAAYEYVRCDERWRFLGEIAPGDSNADDTFGRRVHADDDHVFVGASFDDDVGTDSGTAYVYTRRLEPASPGFVALGDLPGGTFQSRATGISSDGSVAVGYSSAGGDFQAFEWNAVAGIQSIGETVFPGAPSPGVADVSTSRKGCTIAGRNGQLLLPQGWVRDERTGFFLALAPANAKSGAFAVSSDGDLAVGAVIRPVILRREASIWYWPYLFDPVYLGFLSGGGLESRATGVSGDGSVVVGWSDTAQSLQRAFVWDAVSGMTEVPAPIDPTQRSAATAVSEDGATVVGQVGSEPSSTAFAWSAQGGFLNLGVLPGMASSTAFAVSADGSVVVGRSAFGDESTVASEAFIWDAANGMRALSGVLDEQGVDLTGWELLRATGVSADGTRIVGTGINPAGDVEAFLVALPEPSGPLVLGVGGLLGAALARRRARRYPIDR